MEKMKIEIWSDIACPFCYIGKRKLEKALSQFPNRDKVELVWHSYELDPELPKEPYRKGMYNYFSEKYGVSVDEARATMAKTESIAKEVGLNYDFENLVVANTSDALRLVKLAKEQSLATETEEVLFEAYFVKGLDISDRDTLVRLGVSVGLKEEDVISLLDSDKYLDEIKQDIEYSENTLNLEYIPFYVFNNKEMVEGSIAIEDYLKVLTKSYEEWEQNGEFSGKNDGEIISGQSCSIDGVCS